MTTVFTIGHSTRSLDAFVALLRQADIEAVADVRRFPASRRHPHFNSEALAQALPAHGIDYRHFAALGGRRQPRTDSPNALWTESGFRGYADYALTAPFRGALAAVEELAREKRTALMCAEAVWWRCHRRIVADYLLAGGFDVCHILGVGKVEPARLTPGASIDAGAVRYPALRDDDQVGDLFAIAGGGRTP